MLKQKFSFLSFWNRFSLHQVPLSRFLGLFFLGVMSRLFPHPPNFTALDAIALFSFSSLGGWGASFITLFSILFFSDLVIGFHSTMLFVYLSLGLMIPMGHGLKSKRSPGRATALLGLSSLLFFILTNFGVWLYDSMYPATMAGLILCYINALPFLVNHLVGSFFYGGVLFLAFDPESIEIRSV